MKEGAGSPDLFRGCGERPLVDPNHRIGFLPALWTEVSTLIKQKMSRTVAFTGRHSFCKIKPRPSMPEGLYSAFDVGLAGLLLSRVSRGL